MKILYHHRTLGDGAEGIHIAAMVEAFCSLGHEVRVAAVIGKQTNVSRPLTRFLTKITHWAPRSVYEAMELGYNLAGYHMLKRYIKRWRPDVLYERYSLYNIAGLLITRQFGIPFVLEVNSPLAYERTIYESLVLQKIARRCENFVCSRAGLVVVVSTPLKNYLAEQGVPIDRIVVFPNGVNPKLFRPDTEARKYIRRQFHIPEEAVVIGFAGILRPWHGIELLLEALAKMGGDRENVHALIVGDGPSRPNVKKLVHMHGLGNVVTLTGQVPHRDIPGYLATFDIGVSPRATFYASPMKILEYMATGVAVIAPRMLNLHDLITEGFNGILFQPDDANELAAAISLLVRNSDLRYQLGQHARATVLSGRTWQHNANRILELLGKG